MERYQVNRLGMIVSSRAELEAYKAAWLLKPAFVSAVASLDSKIAAINQLTTSAIVPTTGTTSSKNSAKANMFALAYTLSGQAFAYADSINDTDLQAKVMLNKHDIGAYSDIEAAAKCKSLSLEIRAILAQLTDYDVTVAMLDELDVLILAFENGIDTKTVAKTGHSTDLDDIDIKINAAIAFLKNQMDQLMRFFIANNNSFFTAYKKARKIVSTGGNKNKYYPTIDENATVTVGGPRYYTANDTIEGSVTAANVRTFLSPFPGITSGNMVEFLQDAPSKIAKASDYVSDFSQPLVLVVVNLSATAKAKCKFKLK